MNQFVRLPALHRFKNSEKRKKNKKKIGKHRKLELQF